MSNFQLDFHNACSDVLGNLDFRGLSISEILPEIHDDIKARLIEQYDGVLINARHSDVTQGIHVIGYNGGTDIAPSPENTFYTSYKFEEIDGHWVLSLDDDGAGTGTI